MARELKINSTNPLFREKMQKLSRGILNDDRHKITEIVEYFRAKNIMVEYNSESKKIKLIAQGAIPLYFAVEKFA